MAIRKHNYVPCPHFPHIPKAALAALLAAGSQAQGEGCQLWRGLVRTRRGPQRPGRKLSGRSTVAVVYPDGRPKHLAVNRLAWWLYHGTFPGRDGWLSTTCGDLRCIAEGHLRLRAAPVVRDAWPHLSDEALRARLERLSRPGENGCRLWAGTRHRSNGRLQAGIMRVSLPGGRSQHLFAHKLAWFLVHRTYPKEPQILAHACGEVSCINPAHMRLLSRQDHRGLSDAQVAEARAAYWAPRARLNAAQLTMSPPSAEQLAAWSLGMARSTVQAALAGGPVSPGKWRGYAKSVEHVRKAVELFRPAAELHRRAHEGKVSIETLAKRFGSNAASMHGAVHGVSYAHVPMPPEAQARVRREKLDRALAERREAENRAQAELDKLYRQAEGLPEPGEKIEAWPRVVSLSRRSQMADASVFLP